MRNLLVVLLGCGLASLMQAATVAPQPNLDLWSQGIVYAMLEDSDGGLYVGGAFSNFMGEARGNIARVRPDGSLDPDFAPDINNIVYAIVQQDDNSIIVSGEFTRVNNLTRHRLARFLPDGSLDPAWTPQTNGFVISMALEGNSELFIGGNFTEVNGAQRGRIARISLADGSVDEDWRVDANDTVFSVLLADAGSLWVGGAFTTLNETPAERLATVNGELQQIQGYAVNDNVNEISQGSDGSIYVCGQFTEIEGQQRQSLARIDIQGDLDSAWIPSIDGPVYYCNSSIDGLLAAGEFSQASSFAAGGLARFSSNDGLADEDFLPNLNGTTRLIEGAESVNVFVRQLNDGRIGVGGFYRYVDDSPVASGALLNPDSGELVTALDAELSGSIQDVELLNDGNWLIGGTFRRAGTLIRDNLILLDTDGALDTSWTLGTNGTVTSIERIGPSVILGGQFSRLGDIARTSLARIDIETNGPVVNQNWVPLLSGTRSIRTLQRDRGRPNSIYAGGLFEHHGLGGNITENLIRLDIEGTGVADPNLVDLGVNGQINAIAQSENGLLYVGGTFRNARGSARRGLAVFDNNNELTFRPDFNFSLNNSVWALLNDDSTNAIFAAGQFTSALGQSRQRILRLTNNQLDEWAPTISGGFPLSIEPDNSGSIYLAGTFQGINGASLPLLARVDADGTGQINGETSPVVRGSVVWTTHFSPGSLWIGGNFFEVDGQNRLAIARLEITPTEDQIYHDRFQILLQHDKIQNNERSLPFQSSCSLQPRFPFQDDSINSEIRPEC